MCGRGMSDRADAMDSRTLISAHPAPASIKRIEMVNKRRILFKERMKHLDEQLDMGQGFFN